MAFGSLLKRVHVVCAQLRLLMWGRRDFTSGTRFGVRLQHRMNYFNSSSSDCHFVKDQALSQRIQSLGRYPPLESHYI